MTVPLPPSLQWASITISPDGSTLGSIGKRRAARNAPFTVSLSFIARRYDVAGQASGLPEVAHHSQNPPRRDTSAAYALRARRARIDARPHAAASGIESKTPIELTASSGITTLASRPRATVTASSGDRIEA